MRENVQVFYYLFFSLFIEYHIYKIERKENDKNKKMIVEKNKRSLLSALKKEGKFPILPAGAI